MKEFVFIPDVEIPLSQTLDRLDARFGTMPITQQARFGSLAMSESSRDVLEVADIQDSKAVVVDTVEQTGAALVAVDTDADDLPDDQGGSFFPVVQYETAQIRRMKIGRKLILTSQGGGAADFFHLQVQMQGTAAPVTHTVVQLIITNDIRLSAVTDADGHVIFPIRGNQFDYPLVVVEPGFAGHWGGVLEFDMLHAGDVIEVTPIDLDAQRDSLRHMAQGQPVGTGQGVRIGVIDTGVGPHRDLPNAVGDEDTTHGHGTHVAGIISGRGPGLLRGLAPAADIFSYRVFDDPAIGMTANFRVYKAIIQAADEGCHLVNLSLKIMHLPSEPVVGRAIQYARNKGTVCVAAAGNDYGQPVAFPANHADCIAVSACGHEQGFPTQANDRWTFSDIRAADDELFFAKFSNMGIVGTDVDYIAPGCGIISTVPGDQYAPMSGTSMACPAAVGAMAQHLSNDPGLLSANGDIDRFDRMKALFAANRDSLGFVQEYEGTGMIAYGH